MAAYRSSVYWTPPEEGSFNVNCAARTGRGIAGILAIARNCNGDVIGATFGRVRYNKKIDAQLESVLAAYSLIYKLTEKGIVKNNLNITIMTHHKRAVQLINGGDSEGIYLDEEEDDVSDDDDFGGEDEYATTLIGEAECAAGLPQAVKDEIEKEKVRAGLPVKNKATTVDAKKEAKNVSNSAASGNAKDVVKSAASKAASNELTVKGAGATEEAAGSAVLEVANQIPNTEDSTALEEKMKDLSVEDLKIME